MSAFDPAIDLILEDERVLLRPLRTEDHAYLLPISMSAPATNTHHFTAKYVRQDPDAIHNTNLHDLTLYHVSHCECWILDRTNSTTDVTVTLSFDSVRSCGVTDLTRLAVARWNGSTWKDHGNGGTTGTLVAGTVRTSDLVTSFSPFTRASLNATNPLPIELLSFNAVLADGVVRAEWATASGRDNDRFDVEHSFDGTFRCRASATTG